MFSLESFTTFLGWCTVLNVGILFISTISVWIGRDLVTNIHAKLFKMDEKHLPQLYFQYLAQYKTLTLVFNLAPYVAMKIMT